MKTVNRTRTKARCLTFQQLPKKVRWSASAVARHWTRWYRQGSLTYGEILRNTNKIASRIQKRFGLPREVMKQQLLMQVEMFFECQDFELPADDPFNCPPIDKERDGRFFDVLYCE